MGTFTRSVTETVGELEQKAEKALERTIKDLQSLLKDAKTIRLDTGMCSVDRPSLPVAHTPKDTQYIGYILPLKSVAVILDDECLFKTQDTELLLNVLEKLGYKIERNLEPAVYIEDVHKRLY